MDTRRARILIVDDEIANIHVLMAALKADYEIDTACCGEEAISKVKKRMPDLILLDVMMPDMNGFEVCAILKADEAFAHIPVIFQTAMETVEGEMKGLEAGGIDYLTKPVNIKLVRLRVLNHIELLRRSDIIRKQRDLLVRQKEELEATLARVKRLEGIIPICMHCKAIRSTDDAWHQLEDYISEHSDALFSHGICPDCFAIQVKGLET